MQLLKRRQIIFLFLVLTILPSISTVAFVTGNVNTVFAKRSSGGGSNSTESKGGGGGGSSGGDGSNNSPPSTETTPPTTTPPSTETTPPTTTPPSTETTPPTTTPPPATNQSAANAAKGGTPRVVPECITAPCNMAPGVPQTTSPALSNQTAVPPGTPPLTPEQLYESCLQGIGGGIPGNCKPPTTSPALSNQTVAPQTLIPQTCPLPPDSNGKCPGSNVRGPIPRSDGTYRLPTFPPIFGGAEADILGRCPSGSHKIVIINKCVLDNEVCPVETHPVGDLCSRLPVVEIPANPDGSCEHVLDPISNKCYKDPDHAPPCPGGTWRDPYGFCNESLTGTPVPVVPEISDGICENGGVHIALKHGLCFAESTLRNVDGSCQTGYISTGNSCTIRIHDPLPDGSCPGGYSNFAAPTPIGPGGTLCKLNFDKSPANPTAELPGGYCPTGYHHVSLFTRFRYCQLN
jgi:hypothetical protein